MGGHRARTKRGQKKTTNKHTRQAHQQLQLQLQEVSEQHQQQRPQQRQDEGPRIQLQLTGTDEDQFVGAVDIQWKILYATNSNRLSAVADRLSIPLREGNRMPVGQVAISPGSDDKDRIIEAQRLRMMPVEAILCQKAPQQKAAAREEQKPANESSELILQPCGETPFDDVLSQQDDNKWSAVLAASCVAMPASGETTQSAGSSLVEHSVVATQEIAVQTASSVVLPVHTTQEIAVQTASSVVLQLHSTHEIVSQTASSVVLPAPSKEKSAEKAASSAAQPFLSKDERREKWAARAVVHPSPKQKWSAEPAARSAAQPFQKVEVRVEGSATLPTSKARSATVSIASLEQLRRHV